MTLSEMRQILVNDQITLTKSLGQNFLHDGNQLRRIAAAAELTLADNVLEIGPGLGPLTELLLTQAGRVLAVEKDERLVKVLHRRFADHARLELITGDALDYLRDHKRDWSGWKLVANLPYSVASPILVELAQCPHPPERLVATLQLEVVQRIVASANEDDYGLLSLLLQVVYRPVEYFKIPAGCFHPAPDVDSACVALIRRETPLIASGQMGIFTRLVKGSFSQRRKMMLKLLKQQWPAERLVSAFEAVGLSQQVRAEAVTLEQFAALTKNLAEKQP